MRPKVKICGITNLGDALLAESLGADFIGFVFAEKSPRRVTETAAKEISAALTTARAVGVFVEHSRDETERIAEECGLWGVQHYSYFPEGFWGPHYIYALRLGAPAMPQDFSSLKCDYMLIDSYDEKQHGGTGKTFDWSELPSGISRARVFLAGGLGPHNICAAAREKTFSLDLSSSVEARPGKKDPAKLKQVFTNLNNCEG